MQYMYEPIPAQRCVRLLKIEYGTGQDPIRLSLRTVSLDEQLVYYAVSYTWNGAELSESVQCYDRHRNAKELKTNPGSCLVLGRLRDSEFVDSELWIDAFCINQRDMKERESQIQLMKDVYSQAEKTFVYLGEPKEPGNLAIQLCERIIEMAKKFKPAEPIELSNLQAFDLPAIQSPEWKALYDLFCQPWFKRVWIRQEYVLSRSVLMLYGGIWRPSEFYLAVDDTLGSDEYGLEKVLRSVERVDKSRIMDILSGKDASYLADISPAIRYLWRMDTLRIIKNTNITNWDLILLFARSFSVQAHDPRDHIYGVLGLLSDDDREEPDLQPDYSLDVSQTYTKAARYLLHKVGLEKMLQLVVGQPRNITTLPSWVPDWTTMKLFTDIDLTHIRQYFSAGGQQIPVWKVLAEDTPAILSVEGRLAEDVTDVCSPLEQSTGSGENPATYFFWRTHSIVTQFYTYRSDSHVQSPSQTANSHIRTFMLGESPAVLQKFFGRLELHKRQTLASRSETVDLKRAPSQTDAHHSTT